MKTTAGLDCFHIGRVEGSAQSSVVPRAGRKARQFEGVSGPETEGCKGRTRKSFKRGGSPETAWMTNSVLYRLISMNSTV
jgi:hypothetical protein